MTDYYVRWGTDVDPYVRRLASEYIAELSDRCDGIARKVMRARARAARVATITSRVSRGMLNGAAHYRFRKLGFHFVLNETPNQPANVRKREFVLNFATKPEFAPEDMPLRLRKRKGKAVSAKPAKAKKKRRSAARLAARQVRRIVAAISRSFHSSARAAVTSVNVVTHYAANLASVITNVTHNALPLGRTLKLLLYKAWRRRPRVAPPTRRLNLVHACKELLTRMREPPACTPTRAWLERRDFGSSFGFSLSLNVLASSEPSMDGNGFPYRGPPEESERLAL